MDIFIHIDSSDPRLELGYNKYKNECFDNRGCIE